MIENNTCVTSCGPVKGITLPSGVNAFRGIRYATAGRWEYPVKVTHWDGVYDASHFGPNAMQPGAMKMETEGNDFYKHEFREGISFTYSEDCQYLNVYAPQGAKKAPVIVYIHGGAYMNGSGWDKVFEEPVWPSHGIVGVTLNYRLGVFSGPVFEELIQEAGHAGNYNVYDQLTAMQWIHENIEAFGGDPDNITIMGQSAGARSVQMLCVSPEMKGIAKHAFMSSGGGIPSHLFSVVPTQEDCLNFWQEWRRSIGNPAIDELRAMPAFELMENFFKLFNTNGFQKTVLFISPYYDGVSFFKPGTCSEIPNECLSIPYMVGGNTEDISLDLAKDGLAFTSSRQEPSYAYLFSRQLPGDDKGAWHSADLWYWFGSLKNCWRPFTEEDYRLSETMAKYLENFARTGDPNSDGLPSWQSAQESHQLMRLDLKCGMEAEPMK